MVPRPLPAALDDTVVRQLSAHLFAAASATDALHAWCCKHRIGEGPIVAQKHPVEHLILPEDDVLDWFEPGDPAALRYRRVTLRRGEIGLSDCELWWLPHRLPAPMVAALETTSIPFGAIVADLRPRRRTVFEALYSAGLPHVLEHRAILVPTVGSDRPIAAVKERYRPALILPRRRPPPGAMTPRTCFIGCRGGTIEDYAFPSRTDHARPIFTRQYARLVDE